MKQLADWAVLAIEQARDKLLEMYVNTSLSAEIEFDIMLALARLNAVVGEEHVRWPEVDDQDLLAEAMRLYDLLTCLDTPQADKPAPTDNAAWVGAYPARSGRLTETQRG